MDSSQVAKRGVVLAVPYAEKEDAKKLGARWDAEIKSWFVPQGMDSSPFRRWIKATSMEGGEGRNQNFKR